MARSNDQTQTIAQQRRASIDGPSGDGSSILRRIEELTHKQQLDCHGDGPAYNDNSGSTSHNKAGE